MNIGTMIATLGVDTKGLVAANAAMTNFQKRTIASLNTMSQRFRTFGYLAGAAVTLPMVMAGKASFNAAKDFEFEMQKIVGLTGVAQGEVDKWSKQLLKMGPSLAKGPQELAEALYFVSSSGIQGAEALDVVRISAKAATAGLGKTQDVADVLTSSLNAYAGTGLNATKATDIMIAAVRVGKIEADQFASAVGQVIPIASAMGVELDQVAGGMAAISLTGSTASQAATYLKGIFNSLWKESEKGKKSLSSMNSSYSELRQILGNQGLVPLLQKIRDMSMEYGDTLASRVFPNIRALTGYLSIAGKNFKYNTEIMDQVTNSAGSLATAVSAVAHRFKFRMDAAVALAQSSMISLGKSVGETVLPLFEKLVKTLERVSISFDSLSDAEKRHKINIALWVAAAGPAALAISLIGYSASALMAIFAKLAKSFIYLGLLTRGLRGNFGSLKGAMLMNATLTKGLTRALTNPYVLAAAAVTALIIGLKRYQNKVKEIAKAHDLFYTSTVKVNGELKKLMDLTSDDMADMTGPAIDKTMIQTRNAWIEAEKKWQQLEKNKALGWKINQRANLKMQQAEYDKITQLKAIYDELSEAKYTSWKQGLDENNATTMDKIIAANFKNQNIHKLILEQYDAELRAIKRVTKEAQLLKELQSKEPISYRKLFLSTAGIDRTFDPFVNLENQYAKGLITYKKFLDEKYRLDVINAGQSTAAKMKAETEYINNIRDLNRSNIQSYLQSTSNAISNISSLIEASKQRELSAVGDNAKQREKIEREYLRKQKGWAIAQALINGALAVTNMIGNVPLSVLNPATWVGIGVAMGSVAAQIAIISGQHFKTGGIVPAGYPGDSYPALLTSGEAVIPPGRLPELNQTSGEVVFRIHQDELVGILQKAAKKNETY